MIYACSARYCIVYTVFFAVLYRALGAVVTRTCTNIGIHLNIAAIRMLYAVVAAHTPGARHPRTGPGRAGGGGRGESGG